MLAALDELERRGYIVSPLALARYTALLPTRTQRRVRFTRVPYTELELDLLEWVILLKGIGMSNQEVRQWLTNPDLPLVVRRMSYVKRMVARADALLTKTVPTHVLSPTRRPA